MIEKRWGNIKIKEEWEEWWRKVEFWDEMEEWRRSLRMGNKGDWGWEKGENNWRDWKKWKGEFNGNKYI